MGLPQILLAYLLIMYPSVAFMKDGLPRAGRYCFWTTFLKVCTVALLLQWGGFWGGLFGGRAW